jgi:preprotein translocase subunit SecA
MMKWLSSLTDSNEKQIQRLRPLIEEIGKHESEFNALSNEALKVKTQEFKDYLINATSEIREELKQNQQETEDTRNKLNTTDTIEREELNNQIKRFEERRDRLEKEQRESEKEALDELLPEAFALVREAAKRTIGQRAFDVQLIGGIVLHQGKIAEMKTGEGKTLTATLPLYLNCLTGRGSHLVTVNDYLAKTHAHWMGPIYYALGISVSAIHSQTAESQSPSFVYDPSFESTDKNYKNLRPVSRKEAYQADITYGTNNEFGFDYLRDNMVIDLSQCVQRPLNYAIVDEVDNLLIDEARTPLIISGPPPKDEEKEKEQELYRQIAVLVKGLQSKTLHHEPATPEEREEEASLENEVDYIKYEKSHNIKGTSKGLAKLARAFNLNEEELFKRDETENSNYYDNTENQRLDSILSVFNQSLLAKAWYEKGRDYIIYQGQSGEKSVVIVDEFTGRLMHGRRYSKGLHEAIEAKESLEEKNLNIQRESMTYATITFQNYFRMYRKLAGMTGTAQTEAEEFHKIYKLEVIQMPTNRPMIRHDFTDRIYKDEKSKFNAVVNAVVELHAEKRPILIGTVAIETSEMLADSLKRKGVPAKILNAKPENAQREAGIVAEAGRLGAVTVATNMAGRGVDIILGGNPQIHSQGEWQKEHDEVIKLGGLHIIGTERHEARRIDNQLRGRAGRQGDPGSSQFYVSLDDDIMKRFGGDRIRGLMQMAGMDENTPIENRLVNRAIESAQVRVEGYHFDVRKQLVEFDDVVNKHRELIYAERRKILSGADLKSNILTMVKDEVHDIIASQGTPGPDGWDIAKVLSEVNQIMLVPSDMKLENLVDIKPPELEDRLVETAKTVYAQREQQFGPQNTRILERLVMLRIIDKLWIEHVSLMEEKRQQAGFAGLQQIKPIDEYRRLGSDQLSLLVSNIRREVAHTIFHMAITQERQRQPPKQPAPSPMAQVVSGRTNKQSQTQFSGANKVGRNDPCPCGSGKKYKHCHGK